MLRALFIFGLLWSQICGFTAIAASNPKNVPEAILLGDEQGEEQPVLSPKDSWPFVLLVGELPNGEVGYANGFQIHQTETHHWILTNAHFVKRASRAGVNRFFALFYDDKGERQTVALDPIPVFLGILSDDNEAKDAKFLMDVAILSFPVSDEFGFTQVADIRSALNKKKLLEDNDEVLLWTYLYDSKRKSALFRKTTCRVKGVIPSFLGAAFRSRELVAKKYYALGYTIKDGSHDEQLGVFLDGPQCRLFNGMSGGLITTKEFTPIAILHTGVRISEISERWDNPVYGWKGQLDTLAKKELGKMFDSSEIRYRFYYRASDGKHYPFQLRTDLTREPDLTLFGVGLSFEAFLSTRPALSW